jgi:hypothetical protein
VGVLGQVKRIIVGDEIVAGLGPEGNQRHRTQQQTNQDRAACRLREVHQSRIILRTAAFSSTRNEAGWALRLGVNLDISHPARNADRPERRL